MFYKIIKNNTVIDVNNEFFKTQKKPHLIIKCDPIECEYVRSSNGEKLYYSAWTATAKYPFKFPEWVDDIIPISEEEYLQLKEQLQVHQKIEYKENKQTQAIEVVSTTVNVEEPEVLDMIAMKRKIVELETLVQQLLNK